METRLSAASTLTPFTVMKKSEVFLTILTGDNYLVMLLSLIHI